MHDLLLGVALRHRARARRDVVTKGKRVTFETAVGDQVWQLTGLTEQEIARLPLSIPWQYAAVAMGLRRGNALEMVARGQWPPEVPLRQVGRQKMALKADVIRYLGAGGLVEAVTADRAGTAGA